MKKIFVMSLIMVPLTQAMDVAHVLDGTKAKQEVSLPNGIMRVLKDDIAQVRAQENTAELASLFACLKSLDKFCQALRSYTPLDASTSEQWQSLKTALVLLGTSDFTCKNCAHESLSNLSCLGIAVKQCHDLVKRTKGSERTLTISRDNISKGIQELRHTLTKVKALDKGGVLGIMQHVPYILELMKLSDKGIEDALIKMQPLRKEMCAHTSQIKELLIALNAQKEVAFFWSNCLHISDKKLQNEAAALKATRERSQANNDASALPEHIERSLQTCFPERSLYPVKNKDNETYREYVKALGIVFESYYKKIHGNECTKEVMHKALFEQILQLRSSSLQALKETRDTCTAQLQPLLAKIQDLQAKIETLKNTYREDTSALLVIEALEAAHILSVQEHYALTLVTIIESVDRMISPWVEMLNKEDRNEIFLAIKTLSSYPGFLSEVALQGNKAIANSRKI